MLSGKLSRFGPAEAAAAAAREPAPAAEQAAADGERAHDGAIRSRSVCVNVHVGVRTRSNAAFAERVFTSVARSIVATPNEQGHMETVVTETLIGAERSMPLDLQAGDELPREAPLAAPADEHVAVDPAGDGKAGTDLAPGDEPPLAGLSPSGGGAQRLGAVIDLDAGAAQGVDAAGSAGTAQAAGLHSAADGASSSAGPHAATAPARVERVQAHTARRGGGRAGRRARAAIGIGISAAIVMLIVALVGQLSSPGSDEAGEPQQQNRTAR